jgi:glycosyltransferase domain-containing protein
LSNPRYIPSKTQFCKYASTFFKLLPSDRVLGGVVNRGFENLTVCILTRNHPENLIRQINYYSKHNIQLIILDASDRPFIQPIHSMVEYHHVADWRYHKRLIFLRECIKTQYMVLQADDDFHGTRGLLKNLNFLSENPSYTCSQGTYIRVASHEPFIWWPDYKFQSRLKIEYDEVTLRIKEFALSDMHFIYSVTATETFRKVTLCLEGIESGVLTMNELAFNFCLGIFGKYRALPGFYSARDKSDQPISYGFIDWEDSNSSGEFLQFKRNLEMIYRRYGGLSNTDSQNLIATILDTRRERDISRREKEHNSKNIPHMASLFNNDIALKIFALRGKSPISLAVFRVSSWKYVIMLIRHKSLIPFLLDFMEIRGVIRRTNLSD